MVSFLYLLAHSEDTVVADELSVTRRSGNSVAKSLEQQNFVVEKSNVVV